MPFAIRIVQRNPSGITDRAKRYRAQNNVTGPKKCVICGKGGKLDVMHLDGNESNGEKANLAYGCRSCNAKLSAAFKEAGLGVRTRQYNGIPTYAQYAWAVSQYDHGKGPGSSDIIHATPEDLRSEYAARIAETKRSRRGSSSSRDEVPF